MKKLLVVLGVSFLLAGCGGSNEPVKKTCSMEAGGIKFNVPVEGEGDTLKKIAMEISASYEAMGFEKDSLTDEVKKTAGDAMKKELLKEMDLKESDGYDVTSEFNDEGYKMTVSAEASIFETTFNATSIEDFVKEMEDMGMTCK